MEEVAIATGISTIALLWLRTNCRALFRCHRGCRCDPTGNSGGQVGLSANEGRQTGVSS